jgi:hypothetical protein
VTIVLQINTYPSVHLAAVNNHSTFMKHIANTHAHSDSIRL